MHMSPGKPAADPTTRKQKRSIDSLRESAGSMSIGTEEEGPITGFYKIGDRLLILKKSAVYEVIFADAIDPARTNPAIPNTQQRILMFGSDSVPLGRTLLTADALLKRGFLPEIDVERGRELALQIAKDVSGMVDTFDRLEGRFKEVYKNLEGARLSAGFSVPTVENLETEMKGFIQKANHLVNALLEITRLFYGTKVTHADSLQASVDEQHDADEDYRSFVADIVPVLRQVRDYRNAVEHPKATEQVVLRDFKLGAEGKVTAPSIELLHPLRPFEAVGVYDFMRSALANLTEIFENLLAFMCDRHCKSEPFPLSVGTLSDSQRQYPHVRFGYVAQVGENVLPMSGGE